MLLPGIRVVTRAGRAARSRELLTNSDFDTGVCGAWFSSVDSNNRVSGFWSGLALVASRGLLALPGPTLFSLPRACSPARRAWWGATCARPRGGTCRSGTRCRPPDWPPPRLFGRGRPSRLAALCFLGVRSLRLLSHLALGSGGGGATAHVSSARRRQLAPLHPRPRRPACPPPTCTRRLTCTWTWRWTWITHTRLRDWKRRQLVFGTQYVTESGYVAADRSLPSRNDSSPPLLSTAAHRLGYCSGDVSCARSARTVGPPGRLTVFSFGYTPGGWGGGARGLPRLLLWAACPRHSLPVSTFPHPDCTMCMVVISDSG